MPQLTKDQNFGVLVLDFEGGRLPVGAIRRLVQRSSSERTRKGCGTLAQWDLHDLLFFCLRRPERLLHVVSFREKVASES